VQLRVGGQPAIAAVRGGAGGPGDRRDRTRGERAAVRQGHGSRGRIILKDLVFAEVGDIKDAAVLVVYKAGGQVEGDPPDIFWPAISGPAEDCRDFAWGKRRILT